MIVSSKKFALVFLFTLSLFFDCAIQTYALTQGAASITVLALPTATISSIDPNNGIVTLSLPDIDTSIKADLRASLSLYDESDMLLETSEVKITDPTLIKVPFTTQLQVGYKVAPIIKNNDVEAVSTGGVTSKAASSGNGSTTSGGVSGGSGSGKTVYVVTETTPETVTVEKTVMVVSPSEAAQSSVSSDVPTNPSSVATWGDSQSQIQFENEQKPLGADAIQTEDIDNKTAEDDSMIFSIVMLIVVAILLSISLLAALKKRKTKGYDEKK